MACLAPRIAVDVNGDDVVVFEFNVINVLESGEDALLIHCQKSVDDATLQQT